jgi:hypothetical protein
MKNFLAGLFVFLLGFLSAGNSFGQNSVEMADQLRADGKIYVVVGVFLLISAGILTYLIFIDLRLKKLEKQRSENQKELKK